jgi:hypothetical protein
MMSIQSSNYKKALADLERISATPGATEEQKKVANDLAAQITKKIASLTPPGQ